MTDRSCNKRKNKPYYSYRDSGVEWLGKIPEHWKVIKLKFTSTITMGQSPDSDDYLYTIESEALPFLQGNADFKDRFPQAHIFCNTAKKIAKKGELLLSVRAPVGEINEADKKYGIGRGLCSINTNCEIQKKFLWYLLQLTREELYAKARGSTYDAVSVDEVKNIKINLPSLSEQKIIAAFLDKKTSQIDSLIQKKEQQIELLKDKRSALITQAVTKGLNTNVKMKDSGTEWIGKMPKHWEIKKLKYCCKLITTKTSNKDYLVALENIESWTGNFLKTETEFDGDGIEFKKGDILFGKLRPYLAKVLVSSKKGSGVGDLFVLRPFKEISSYYLGHLLRMREYIQVINSSTYGVKMPRVNWDFMSNLLFILPSYQEQKSIIDFLDKKTAQIDSLTEKTQKSIDLLKEYRSALITSVVTGKVDVRESQKEVTNVVQLQSSRKEASTLFKKTVLGAEIVSQLKNDSHFGRTKFMKTLYLCETHLQIPLKGTYKREAAGPLDNSIYKVEGIMKKNKWFGVVKIGSMHKYKPLKNSKDYKFYFDKYWGDYTEKLNQFLSLAKKFTTEQSEIIDTIYAVWNDFLIEGKTPSDNEVIYEVKTNWHKSKKRFSDERLKKAIQWMKEQNLVPQGYGSKTKAT